MNEDVFPIENGDVSNVMLVLHRGLYNPTGCLVDRDEIPPYCHMELIS